jgi:hypothetical protein
MTDRCPTCGRPLPDAQEQVRLLELLRDGHPHRQVYRASNGSGWFVTHGGGQFSVEAVQALIDAGLIHDVYNNLPNECYHVGRTLDVDRTVASRKKYQKTKDAPKIYVGDP